MKILSSFNDINPSPIREMIEGILEQFMFEMATNDILDEIKRRIEMALSQLGILDFEVKISMEPDGSLKGRVTYREGESLQFKVIDFTILPTGKIFSDLDEKQD